MTPIVLGPPVGPEECRPVAHHPLRRCQTRVSSKIARSATGCWWCAYAPELRALLQVETEPAGRLPMNTLMRAGARTVADLQAYEPFPRGQELVDGLYDVRGLGVDGVGYVRGRLEELEAAELEDLVGAAELMGAAL